MELELALEAGLLASYLRELDVRMGAGLGLVFEDELADLAARMKAAGDT